MVGHMILWIDLIIGGKATFSRIFCMRKNKKKFMDLNRETAMRLWNKTFGKETIVYDFTGRKIVKGAYNDRESNYGWNVDHILPQSRGGATADHNLICCHILTNDEKANKFPCFKANGINFKIIKVENHYEIKQLSKNKNQTKVDEGVNYYDSASGVRFFKKLKGIQNKPRFMGVVTIKLQNGNTALINFIECMLENLNINITMKKDFFSTKTVIVATNLNMPKQADISELLDICILLNTYLSHYFKPMQYLEHYEIVYQVNYYEDKEEMYIDMKKITSDNFGFLHQNNLLPSGWLTNRNYSDTLFINKLVVINTNAKNNVEIRPNDTFAEYNYIFRKLLKNLEKEVSRE